jgi:citrate synthase
MRYFTAKEAAGALGVTLPTLYAYTSRGQLQSEPAPGRPRERRYFREDIERLRERKEARRDPDRAAARGLRWGSPVLASGITLIQNGKLYYCGRDVLRLAEEASLEQAAELLWAAEGERLFDQPCPLSLPQLARLRACARDPLTLLQAALPVAGAADLAAYDLRPAAVRQTGARIVRLLTAIVTGGYSQAPVHTALQAAWAPKRKLVGEAIRTALVVCADHELNVSAFTARCAASAGASPYDVVSAALATLKGRRHGGETERVAALFEETCAPGRARAVVANRLRRGESLPGFGHPLYPGGDPRAALLLQCTEASGNAAEMRLVRALRKAGSELLNELPNLDFGLAAVARTYGLPNYAPLVLFALGRTVGWIAHAIEQYSTGELIRPRARYTGPAPEA